MAMNMVDENVENLMHVDSQSQHEMEFYSERINIWNDIHQIHGHIQIQVVR